MRVLTGWLVAIAVAAALPVAAEARVRVAVEAPTFVVPEPSEMVLIPGAIPLYFYAAPDADVYFHAGWWWTPWHGRWFRAAAWNGPWVLMETRLVPRVIVALPGDVRTLYGHRPGVPWPEWRMRHWRPAARPPAYVPRHYYTPRERWNPPPRVERGGHDHGYAAPAPRPGQGRGRVPERGRGEWHDRGGKGGGGHWDQGRRR